MAPKQKPQTADAAPQAQQPQQKQQAQPQAQKAPRADSKAAQKPAQQLQQQQQQQQPPKAEQKGEQQKGEQQKGEQQKGEPKQQQQQQQQRKGAAGKGPAAAAAAAAPADGRPTTEARDAAIKAHQERIAALTEQQKAAREAIEAKKTANAEYVARKRQLVNDLRDVNGKLKGLFDEVAKIKEHIVEKEGLAQKAHKAAEVIVGKIVLRSMAQLDEAIASRQARMEEEGVTLAEEKRLLTEISRISARRPDMQKIEGDSHSAENLIAEAKFLKQKQSEISPAIKEFKEQQNKLRAELDALSADPVATEFEALNQTLTDIKPKIDAEYEGIRKERAKFEEALSAWRREQDEARAQARKDFKQRQREAHQSREQEQHDREANQKKNLHDCLVQSAAGLEPEIDVAAHLAEAVAVLSDAIRLSPKRPSKAQQAEAEAAPKSEFVQSLLRHFDFHPIAMFKHTCRLTWPDFDCAFVTTVASDDHAPRKNSDTKPSGPRVHAGLSLPDGHLVSAMSGTEPSAIVAASSQACRHFLESGVLRIPAVKKLSDVRPEFASYLRLRENAFLRHLHDDLHCTVALPNKSTTTTKATVTISGTVEGTRRAFAELSAKINEELACAVVKAGRSSSTLFGLVQSLQAQTGTFIKVPPKGSKSDEVIVVGPRDSVERAKALIGTQEVLKVPEVPVEVDRYLKEYERIDLAALAPNYTELIRSMSGLEITGPPAEAKALKDLILRNAANVHSQTIEVPKDRQDGIRGAKNAHLADLEHSCGVVIAMPPASSDSTTVTIYGRPERVERALLAFAPPVAAEFGNVTQFVHKYLKGAASAAVSKIASHTGTTIKYEPAGEEFKVLVHGAPSSVEEASTSLATLLQAVTVQKADVPAERFAAVSDHLAALEKEHKVALIPQPTASPDDAVSVLMVGPAQDMLAVSYALTTEPLGAGAAAAASQSSTEQRWSNFYLRATQ